MCKYIMCLFNHYPHQKGYANHNYCVCLQLEFWEHWWLKQATGRLQLIQGSKLIRGFR